MQFVPSISGRNIVYGPEVDVSQMTREERQSCQAAMRQCRRRQKLAEQKNVKSHKRYVWPKYNISRSMPKCNPVSLVPIFCHESIITHPILM